MNFQTTNGIFTYRPGLGQGKIYDNEICTGQRLELIGSELDERNIICTPGYDYNMIVSQISLFYRTFDLVQSYLLTNALVKCHSLLCLIKEGYPIILLKIYLH